eukprot:scaffold1781_cov371-Pinguiococcus_pyrenoidosus.AAC.7
MSSTFKQEQYREQVERSGGFNFDNFVRNSQLLSGHENRTKKTGTTICGAVFKDGVVLGADTRATAGTEVFDKNCDKIHFMVRALTPQTSAKQR